MWNYLRLFWLRAETLLDMVPDWLIGLLALIGAALLGSGMHLRRGEIGLRGAHAGR